VTGRFIAAVSCALLLGACGGDETAPAGPLEETAQRLGEIRSGDLDLRMTTSTGDEGASEAGFELTGSFELPAEGGLPVADVDYTQIGGDAETSIGYIATGEQIYVEVEGQAYELAPEQVERFRGPPESDGAGLSSLELETWVKNPQVSEGAAGVEVITGELDVVTALNDLFALAEELGAGDVPQIEGEDVARLQEAVESATIEVQTGAEDRLLRSIVMDVDLVSPLAETLDPSLAGTLGVGFSFELAISNANGDIEVEAPPDALPITDLG